MILEDKKIYPLPAPEAIGSRIFHRLKTTIMGHFFEKTISGPWMDYAEIEFIRTLLIALRPQTCLEWGAGYSTLYFPKLLGREASWTSVDHDKDWGNKISVANRNKQVNIFIIEPNRYPWTDACQDGSYDDLKDYVEFPSGRGPFDFILVDGRARSACLEKAFDLISPKGIVILHDAGRAYYYEPMVLYKHQIMLDKYGRDGGKLWIGSKDLDLKVLINIDQWRALWTAYVQLGKIRLFNKHIFW